MRARGFRARTSLGERRSRKSHFKTLSYFRYQKDNNDVCGFKESIQMNKLTAKIGDHINIKLHKWDATAIEGKDEVFALSILSKFETFLVEELN